MATREWLYRLVNVAVVWSAASLGFAFGQTGADGYLGELDKLDVSRPESTCIARDSLLRFIPEADLGDREKMFRAFRAFYLDAVRRTVPAFLAGMDQYVDDYEQWLQSRPTGSMQQFLKERPDIEEAGSRWFQCGFLMYESEGSLYPGQDSNILLSFAAKLGTSLASFIRFRAVEDREVVIDDAALRISWEELRLKLERWSSFGRGHQELPETKSEIEPYVQSLALCYLFGADNTPTFNSRNGQIDPKLIASWNQFAVDDRSSRYHALISSLVANVSEHGQTITEKDRPLFVKSGLADSFDQWWRLLQLRLAQR